MNFRDSLNINKNGHLEIASCDCVDLCKKYSTPLYVMDIEYIKAVAEAFRDVIKNEYNSNGEIAFASKAFSTTAIYTLMKKLSLSIDVVSKGEMFTANNAGFPLEKAFFHGNNKLDDEIEYAIEHKIGHIVIDNLSDLDIIDKIAKSKNIVQKVLIRINPGVEAHTHEFIQTSKIDSKFGFSILNNLAKEAIEKALTKKNIELLGYHSHIGSQILDTKGFVLAVEKIILFAKEIERELSFTAKTLNFGGGFGVHYTEDDPKFTVDDYSKYVKTIVNELKKQCEIQNYPLPKLILEPGRSIVGEAGITLYSVGTIKDIPGIRKYVNIDGGMTDNIRPALYGAKYEAILANRCNDKAEEIVSVAGKCCESGDIILKDIKLPVAKKGDILAVFTTGAYNYSMASTYNKNPLPAVVFVEKGKSALAVRRQSFDDLISLDNSLEEWFN